MYLYRTVAHIYNKSLLKRLCYVKVYLSIENTIVNRDCHGCDRMVVGFTTTYAISAYHH
jgi:hypothetical protein